MDVQKLGRIGPEDIALSLWDLITLLLESGSIVQELSGERSGYVE